MFAKEGYPFIISFAVALFAVAILPKMLFVFVIAVALALVIWFFRDPERVTPNDDEAIVSSADGKVVEISDVEIDGQMFKKVGVFMNVFSVHVNRVPFRGTIAKIKHIDGTFLPVYKDEAAAQNERCEIHIDTKFGRMIAVQIAGLVARRTVQYVAEGDNVGKGDRLGMIKFSSRVDHYLPTAANIEVTIGDDVTAGITKIARIA